jgi:cell division protein FtsW (lipid II flippase)
MRRTPQESRLLAIAAAFLFLYALALTLAPAVRMRSWQVDYTWLHWIGIAAWLVVFISASLLSQKKIPGHDPYLLPITGLLTGWGLLTIFRLYPESGLRQSAWLLVSGAIYLLGINFPAVLDILRRYKYLWLTLGLAITGLTLLFGTNPLGYGPQMWLGCCGIYLQPSEPLKFLLVAYLAAYLADRLPLASFAPRSPGYTLPDSTSKKAKDPSSESITLPPLSGSLLPLLAPTLVMTGLALVILLVQRDLGTASIFLFVYFSIMYVATGRKLVLGIALAGLVLFATLGYGLFDLVRLRIDAWLNPWLDPSGRSFQIIQSILAVANGGLLGRGPGIGNPGLVPVSHSDFIYASIAEETGLVGGLGVLLLLALLSNRGLRVALAAPNSYQRYLATGLTTLAITQGILIIGGNLRLLPLTGVTLPFVSYGGSSLLVSFLILLILMLISAQPGRQPAFLPNPKHYLQLGGLLLAGLAAAAMVTAWWGVVRGPDLLTRTDNPRRAIADRNVPRGALLDRNNLPLNQTVGDTGSLSRQVLYPELSNIIGYTHPVYGQTGIEAGLDPYLRGLQGNTGLSIWLNHLLYGQPPPGLDVRLSLDLETQLAVEDALGQYSGAAVLLNAQNGEVLAMASHPDFDANLLDSEWERLIKDPNSPLLNRALQGYYPGGGDLAPALNQILMGDNPPGDPPASVLTNPMQMAIAAAALSNNGLQPAASLALAYNSPVSGWTPLPATATASLPNIPGQALQVLSAKEAATAIEGLAAQPGGTDSMPQIWENISCANATALPVSSSAPEATTSIEPGGIACWYVAGTLPTWQGHSQALAVVIEADAAVAVREIGRAIFLGALQP